MSGQPKPILPCVRCGDPGGWASTPRNGRPARYNGEPFGYEGQICMGCYAVFQRRKQGDKKRYRNREATGLAAMVLEFDTARRTQDKAEANRAYRALVRRARFLVDEQREQQQQQAAQP